MLATNVVFYSDVFVSDEVWVPADDGFRQGSPLSCMLAALACVKCVMAAQKAMDDFHSLQRTSGGAVNGGQTVRTAESLKEERRLHELAAAASEAIAMLDDASFVARVRALCGAYAAYTKACQGRGWTCKPSKTVLSADNYRDEEQAVADGFRPVEPPSSDEEL